MPKLYMIDKNDYTPETIVGASKIGHLLFRMQSFTFTTCHFNIITETQGLCLL